ncbi:redoxin domain-containing protein [Conexibacter sp. JD483]|uniref:TlpA family protein disulfide reductase n=1 Tax=unclassified Conexibacter TaxID=2627773 RepID=UPI002720A034|nr:MULTISPECIES: redoxin domain-containing protein [unclassified Conexibacter]MDO8186158.1 redoxin domain-containing protein [Conexibacter sp. CPCC 205706]MDO8199648.1 redoxin domain-containing protein [Conexibacter sp. CPCC 205762]MDR9371802.1 redoxin domain-containing protein [Conexibacter sp. JD483]
MSGPERPPASPPPSPARGRYGWIVGIVGIVVLAYILLNTLRTEGPGSSGPAAGAPLPVFAAPLVDSSLEGDANVATRADQGDAGHVPACAVEDPRALNVCTLVRRGPLVLAFLTAKGGKCADELDAMQEISGRFPDVSFAAVGIKGDREDFRVLAQKHGWRFPLAQDRDGAVANLYGIAVCPTVVLAHRGGAVAETLLGGVSAVQLAERVREL